MAMELTAHALSSAASLAAICASLLGGAGVAIAGKVPRAGPLRALVLGVSSRYGPLTSNTTLSQRDAEVLSLRMALSATRNDQFVVVNGPKGVGKSCLVDTAVRNGWGVVRVTVGAGDSLKDITAATWRAVTRSHMSSSYDHTPSAQRVLFFHKLLFRVPVTVVLQAAERRNGQDYADIAAACRCIVAAGDVRVIVDSSPNSLDESARRTKRERMVQVEPMPRELVERLSGMKALHAALAAAGLADVVWAVLGGYPVDYMGLRRYWEESSYSKEIAPIVEAFVQAQLVAAISQRDEFLAADEHLKPLYEEFTAIDAVPAAKLVTMKLVRPSPDKVLRVLVRAGEPVLVPATPAMALVLRHKLAKAPPLDAIQVLVSRVPAS